MSKTLKRLLFAGLVSVSATAAALEVKSDAPQRYVVKDGDTLWDIAERYTDDAWQWPEIWYQNNQIKNPHLIFPGDVIGLVTINGETKATVMKRGVASRTVKLSPGTVKLQPTARVEPIESAIPAIPLDAIRGFLRDHRVVETDELAAAPRILSGDDGHLIMGSGNRVYARGDYGDEPAAAYGVFRQGQVYRDPETKEVLGLEALEVGLARVNAVDGDIMTLLLERTTQNVNIGDRLLETEDRELITRYYPKPPSKDVTGQILAVSGGVTQVGQFDVVVINRGDRDGVEPGSVLLIEKAGNVVYDKIAGEKVRLPNTRAGTLMVFRTFEKLSYALVMRATSPLRVTDRFVTP
ncbi:LysM peptidoglycan-binding domain-containing protein [Bacterioplanoides sp.]|uniref:LysM peptidoglycan-binding domain-containing protein n=1 Tax=Bacterioplanoides sp. TaxID=2066072 RepID=UPI003B00BE1F